MLQTAHSGEKPAEPPPRGDARVANPKWAALLNDIVVPAPQQRIPATLLRSQAGVGDDLALVRDHNSPDDVIIHDDDTIDLAKGNVFYTLSRHQAGNRGRCQAPPKLAYFVDDRAEITTNPGQSGRTLRELFGLDDDSHLMRDYESPADEPIGPTDSADFTAGPVFVTRQAVPTVIIVNGKRRRVTAPSLTFSELVALAFDSPPSGENICFTITYRNGPCSNPQGSLVEGQTVFITEGMVFNVTATDKS